MKIVILTDAWNQINGVVTTLTNTIKCLEEKGYEVEVIHPDLFKTKPLWFYPEIEVAVNPFAIWSKLNAMRNIDYIHIATESMIGIVGRLWCSFYNKKFTTSYHTNFPDYIFQRTNINFTAEIAYILLRWFHSKSSSIMVNTKEMKDLLSTHGFKDVYIWGRGVDKTIFSPDGQRCFQEYKRPILLNIGRVAVEKNLPDFYNIKTSGTKIQIGSGPLLEKYKEEYKDVVFLGKIDNKDLAEYYRSADVFVFPSKTDTYGLVMAESISCGTPVAAYPVIGPISVVDQNKTGFLDEDLSHAVIAALKLDKKEIINYSHKFSWKAATEQFLGLLMDA